MALPNQISASIYPQRYIGPGTSPAMQAPKEGAMQGAAKRRLATKSAALKQPKEPAPSGPMGY